MADELSIVLGTIFSFLAVIIIIGCIRNCKELIKVEKEMKSKNIVLIPNVINITPSFSEDPV
jgi:hypothetical protein